MNQYEMNPETGLVFRPVGRNLRIGNWSIRDARLDGFDERYVYHYDTLMGGFTRVHDECTWENGDDDMTGPWGFVPVSVGHGSVSDQQGMNRILRGTGWNYRRNGGRPRYEYYGDVVFPAVSQETGV